MVTLDMFRFESDDAVPFPGGTVIFEEGEPGHLMYVVLEGTVRINVHGVDVQELGPGEAFGEMALVDDAPRSATVTAVTDCRLVEIGEKRFFFLVQQHPRFAIQLMRVMTERLRKASAVAADAKATSIASGG